MAPDQTIERALRERFGSEETILTLADILSFLKTHQNSCCAAGNPKKQQHGHGTQQSAPPTQGHARDQARPERVTQGPHSNAAKTQGSQSTAKPPKASQPQGQSQATQATQNQNQATQATQKQNQATQATQNHSQKPKQRPSYADIAKKAPEKAQQQLKKPKKAPTLPESVKLAPRAPKPLKIGLREPIRNTPKELIAFIQERAVNGERLIGLIKAFRLLSPKSLLVYPTTEAAREELSQNTSWLDAIHTSFHVRIYSIVIYRVRRDTPIEEISRRLKE